LCVGAGRPRGRVCPPAVGKSLQKSIVVRCICIILLMTDRRLLTFPTSQYLGFPLGHLFEFGGEIDAHGYFFFGRIGVWFQVAFIPDLL
jgi:hypothetical protein